MRTLFAQLMRDDRGFVVSAELILVATIAVIGCIVGLAAYRDAIVQELGDAGAAVGALNQSYEETYGNYQVNGPGNSYSYSVEQQNCEVEVTFQVGNNTVVTATFNASSYEDLADVCETSPQAPGSPPAGIQFGGTTAEGDDFPPP